MDSLVYTLDGSHGQVSPDASGRLLTGSRSISLALVSHNRHSGRFPGDPCAFARRRDNRRMAGLLHVACHVAVQHHPNEQRSVQPLQVLKHIALRYFDLYPEILLSLDQDSLGEAEGCLRIWIAVRDGAAVFRIWACAGREKPCWHLDHDLFADEEGGHGVVNEIADHRSAAIITKELSRGRHYPAVAVSLEKVGCGGQIRSSEDHRSVGQSRVGVHVQSRKLVTGEIDRSGG